MKRTIVAFVVLLGLTSFGTAITDEHRQLWAFENLRQGEIIVKYEAPHLFDLGNGLAFGDFHRETSRGLITAHSEMVNFLSLPMYGLLDILDAIWPIEQVLVALWAVAAYAAVRWTIDWGARSIGRGPVAWSRGQPRIGTNPLTSMAGWLSRTSGPHRLLILGMTVLGLLLAWRTPSYDFALWGSAMAVQLTMVVASAWGASVVHRLLVDVVGSGWADVGFAMFLTATPLAFWGTQTKYHGVMIVLAAAATYWYARGVRRDCARDRFVGIVCGGLSLWAYASGVILLAGLALAEVIHAPRRLQARLASHSRALAALAMGLVPFLLTNIWMTGNPLTNSYLALSSEAAGEGLTASDRWYGVLIAKLGYHDALSIPEHAGQIYLTATRVEGDAVSMLALTPILALALLLPWLAYRGKVRWDPAFTLGAGILLANWLAYGGQGPAQGAGYDLRYFTFSLVPLAVMALAVLARLAPDLKRLMAWAASAYGLGAVGLLALLLVFAHKNFLFDWTDEMKQPLVVVATLGAAAALGIVASAGAPRLLGRFQQAVLGAFLGLGLLNSHLWVFTTQVIFHTGIPAHDGYPAFNHVLPLTHWLHELAVRWLIPPKWGVA